MVGINKVHLHYSGRDIFKEVSFLINPGEKIGLVGRNGAGKSTLLKVIAGRIPTDGGNISTPSDCKIGFLTQDIHLKKDKTVWQETETTFTEIKHLEKGIHEITHQLEVRTDYESDDYLKLIEDLNHKQDRLHLIGGYTYEADMERVLTGLGFTAEDFHRPIAEFSGGWQMRVELAKILLQKNDLLLLDEPTNHLDIESIIWLEEFLKNEPVAVMLVSHDRAFLNRITTRTIEISHGMAYDFPVPYSKYVNLRAEIREKQLQSRKNQEKEIKQTEQLIEKFRYKASKASFAQTLIKKLDKVELIEVDEEDTAAMRIRFPQPPRSGKVAALMEKIHKNYDDNKVLKGIDLEIARGDRVAFVGQNGQGKTTLIKVIMERVAFEGDLIIGHNVKIGYYAQNQSDELDGNKTLLATIEDAANEETRKRARDMLGSFMFSGEDVDKKVKVLSGGEKARLALCKMLLEPFNLLIMDEPTNHLDMRSKDILKQALQQYEGSLILVSHDRDFLAGLTDKVYEFKGGKTKEYLGDIEFFLEQRKLQNMVELEKKQKAKAQPVEKKKMSNDVFHQKKQLEKDLKKAQNQYSKIESAISDLESQIADWDQKLADPEEFKKLSSEPDFYAPYEALKDKLSHEMKSWESWLERIDALETELSELSAQ